MTEPNTRTHLFPRSHIIFYNFSATYSCLKKNYYLSPFSAAITEYDRLGNLDRKECISHILEAGEFNIKGSAYGRAFLLYHNMAEDKIW
jgi:hypothetical protein